MLRPDLLVVNVASQRSTHSTIGNTHNGGAASLPPMVPAMQTTLLGPHSLIPHLLLLGLRPWWAITTSPWLLLHVPHAARSVFLPLVRQDSPALWESNNSNRNSHPTDMDMDADTPDTNTNMDTNMDTDNNKDDSCSDSDTDAPIKNHRASNHMQPKINNYSKISQKFGHLCGKIKTKAHHVVAHVFKFKSGSKSEAREKNYFFKLFSKVVVALIMAAINCTINKWHTSKRTTVHFTEPAYKPVYKTFLNDLNYFKQEGLQLDVMGKLQHWIYHNGLDHSGVEQWAVAAISMFDAMISHAVIELNSDFDQN
ncbi:hypothetical protein CONPUDRAFT_70147 [Coniophora puteana RWD-64-598 SS2]|uniref:DUF6532 domain-containing protein n=1 Tax=Coniophora puteana (strain RWD-64-598) TaxID=741705 RepID=A0A5M3N1Q4_CONPW|nr:uncharacterized protein CONPUDRAFT_70147 [Coniophora puteana RWD-64-598 SS2]EIW85308.1 hypothetical protein CONPUDRAFT_70147 [Coniophora puteana RWD-64-598 SS2]